MEKKLSMSSRVIASLVDVLVLDDMPLWWKSVQLFQVHDTYSKLYGMGTPVANLC